jgi:uncharacterized protein YgbK (DUF1537 family)
MHGVELAVGRKEMGGDYEWIGHGDPDVTWPVNSTGRAPTPGRDWTVKTVVLDDDPTGTQSASNVRVLLVSDADLLEEALRDAPSVYVQTNTRAVDEPTAVDFVRRVRDDAFEAGRRLGEDVQFVLRGDSTLRGHVFAETEQFLLHDDDLMIFVPAFPAGGRTTRGGVHFVGTGEQDLPAHETEYADDPVFPFASGVLTEFVAEKSTRSALPISLDAVRGNSADLASILVAAGPRTVAVPDAVTHDDIRLIADAIRAARGQVLPGVSVWRMGAVDGREILYVVVPGNVGGPDTLVDVLAAVGFGG